MHRQFAYIAPAPFDSQRSVVGPPGLAKMVFYISKSHAESAVLIGSTMLSIASNLHRLALRQSPPHCQFAPTPSPPFDFRGSVVEPQGRRKMLFYMSKRLAESALLIRSTVLSNDSNSHRQFASIAPTPSPPFDFRGSIVGPQGLAQMLFYMSKRHAESALLIGSTVLSIASNSDRHRSGNSPLHPPHRSNFEEASSNLRSLNEWCSICLGASLKVPY
jgi:hypothetical protein